MGSHTYLYLQFFTSFVHAGPGIETHASNISVKNRTHVSFKPLVFLARCHSRG